MAGLGPATHDLRWPIQAKPQVNGTRFDYHTIGPQTLNTRYFNAYRAFAGHDGGRVRSPGRHNENCCPPSAGRHQEDALGTSVTSTRQFSMSIDREINTRIKIHQSRIEDFQASAATGATQPLVMMAHGDSWFDYPLDGNGISFTDTDIIAKLRPIGTPNSLIVNISHHGDSTIDEMSWPKQQRMLQVLKDSHNWVTGGKPDAILLSGGGNDIAGDQFCMYPQPAGPGGGLSTAMFQGALAGIRASYIAHELVQDIRRNLTVDWAHRESARADIRRRVKRILRKYGYPPNLQDAAVQNVLQQAEALSAELV